MMPGPHVLTRPMSSSDSQMLSPIRFDACCGSASANCVSRGASRPGCCVSAAASRIWTRMMGRSTCRAPWPRRRARQCDERWAADGYGGRQRLPRDAADGATSTRAAPGTAQQPPSSEMRVICRGTTRADGGQAIRDADRTARLLRQNPISLSHSAHRSIQVAMWGCSGARPRP